MPDMHTGSAAEGCSQKPLHLLKNLCWLCGKESSSNLPSIDWTGKGEEKDKCDDDNVLVLVEKQNGESVGLIIHLKNKASKLQPSGQSMK